MFLNKTHQSQLLESQAYFSEQFLEREKERLLFPAWHYVGALDDLQRDGDFLTCQLLGRPIIVWKKSGKLHAFLNVCAHRFSLLTSKTHGCTNRLACQYHGWEYDETGATQRIPDAQSFRPLSNQELGLRRLSVDTAGPLVFVSLASLSQAGELSSNSRASGVTLGEQLGEGANAVEAMFSPPVSLIYSMQEKVEANWKLVIENAIESYHVGCVHADSFQAIPPAESCTHSLSPKYSSFETDAPSQAPKLLRLAERLVHRLVGVPHCEKYTHFLCYPNLLISTSKIVAAAMSVQPLTATSSQFSLQVFLNRGKYSNPAAKAALWCTGKWAIKEICKILREDFSVLPDIQAGIAAPEHPAGGLISCREERVLHFQAMVKAACGED